MANIWKIFTIWCLVMTNTVFGKSFTLVLDTTASMSEEIDIIKANIPIVLNDMNRDDIDNYIVVPFKDPDVGPAISSSNSKEFVDSFGLIRTAGGEDCPENSLAGIKDALEISDPLSYIFLFTDAYAKVYSNVSAITDLCKQKQSKVNIFLSGVCLPSKSHWRGEHTVYYELAKACSGVVFHFDHFNLRQAFRYMRKITKTEWSDITGYDSFEGHKQISLPVNEYVKEMVVAASSEFSLPTMEVVDMNGQKPQFEKVIDTRNSQVFKILNPDTGTYTLNVRSVGIISVAVFIRCQLAFHFGFSTASPSSLLETTKNPLPDRVNYMLIHTQATLRIQSVEIYTLGRETATTLQIEEITPGIHITQVYIEPNQFIKIYVKLQDPDKFSEVSSATHFLRPQKAVSNILPQKPNVEIIEMKKNIVDYESDVRIASKVTGYPKPDIRWEDSNGDEIPSEDNLLEIPSTYISYASIKKLMANITIQCKADNSEGDSIQIFDLYVNRNYSFKVIQTLEDTSIEYGNEGKLYCHIEAYPEARIKWYHNDSFITESDNMQWVPNENALVIKNMSLYDSGNYKCEVTNEVETKSFTAQVDISGIETPEVNLDKTEEVIKLGDSFEIECRIIKGKPVPTVTWLYKSENSYDYDFIPDGVYSDDGILKITSAQLEHKGLYKCEAINIIGEDSREVAIKIEFAPIIKNNEDTTMIVKEGDQVEMSCDVTASPKATVRWEMSQDDVILAFDGRHRTDDRHIHRFNALWKDSGNYHCIAENSIGRAEKTIILIVLVAPYVETPKNQYVTGRIGDEVMFPCNVLYGNPAPSIKWEFIAMDSTSIILKRGNSTNTLHLMKLTRANEGTYLCLAENSVGTDRIKYHLKVQ